MIAQFYHYEDLFIWLTILVWLHSIVKDALSILYVALPSSGCGYDSHYVSPAERMQKLIIFYWRRWIGHQRALPTYQATDNYWGWQRLKFRKNRSRHREIDPDITLLSFPDTKFKIYFRWLKNRTAYITEIRPINGYQYYYFHAYILVYWCSSFVYDVAQWCIPYASRFVYLNSMCKHSKIRSVYLF